MNDETYTQHVLEYIRANPGRSAMEIKKKYPLVGDALFLLLENHRITFTENWGLVATKPEEFEGKEINYDVYYELVCKEGRRHQKTLDNLDEKLRAVQKKCKHPDKKVRYYDDSDGGFYKCYECGFEW